MKLDKAIKNLTKLRDGCGPEMQKYIDACNLGIEALKRCQYIAEHTDRWAGVLLLGETKE